MRDRGHRRIFILLSFCAFSILLVQAFWLRNFYVERTEQFSSGVYSGLEQIVSKLHEREQLKIIKQRGDSILATHKKVVKVLSRRKNAPKASSGSVVSLKSISPPDALVMSEDAIVIATSPSEIAYATTTSKWCGDSLFVSYEKRLVEGKREIQNREKQLKKIRTENGKRVLELNNQMKQLTFSFDNREKNKAIAEKAEALARQTSKIAREDSIREAELEALMERMIAEIEIKEADETHPDSLKQIIGAVLESKGLKTPFEFSMRRIGPEQNEVITQSEGFDSTKSYFKADLSSQRLFKSNNYLLVQFPRQQDVVLAGMRGSLILSLLFTGIILSVFYYTLKLILRQKKIGDIRNDFVNNMTHELKTPIATISLAVDAMQHPQVRSSEERYGEYTRILKEENAKLNAHVERVLQLALFDKGQVEMRRRSTDVAVITENEVKAYRLQADAKGLQLFFSLSGTVFTVFGDDEHLASAISNLIDNAIKYTDRNGVVNVAVSAGETTVCISVSDTGRGIAKNELEKVFDKFYRISNKNLHDVKGFGIGLSYVKSIVEAHGGSISLESLPGKGSTFKITLTRHE